jgi:hypothetical protein
VRLAAPSVRRVAPGTRNAASMLSGSQIASIRYAVNAGLSGPDVRRDHFDLSHGRRGASPLPGIGKSNVNWNGGRVVVMRCPSYLPCTGDIKCNVQCVQCTSFAHGEVLNVQRNHEDF